MKAERLSQVLVFDEPRDGSVDRSVRAEHREGGRHANHVHELQERSSSELLVAFDEYLSTVLQEPLIPGDVFRLECRDLTTHLAGVARVVEECSVFPNQPIERGDWNELD